MSILSAEVKDITGAGKIADLLKFVIGRVWKDPADQAKLALEIETLHQSGELARLTAETGLLQGQLEINKIEAQSDDKFNSRWRPAVGWMCVFAMFWNYFGFPMFGYIAALVGSTVPPPDLDIGGLVNLLLALLGMAGLRSLDKKNGVAS